MTATSAAIRQRVLAEDEWLAAERRHEAVVDEWTAGRRSRALTGERHPVDDFLWTYYTHRPSQLRRWHPGMGVVLAGPRARARLSWPWYRDVADGVAADVPTFRAARSTSVALLRDLLRATAERAAHFGCFGLHEWAMVYRLRPGEQRHETWPLRLSPQETDAVVESRPVRCSHFDAFRFFTSPARSLNVLQPTRSDQVAMEQPGCLHATMDLYKAAYKLSPMVPAALLRSCFALAREVRELDMRASPYDLARLGLSPVAIETAAGRAEYVAAQRGFSERGQDLRHELLTVCEAVLA